MKKPCLIALDVGSETIPALMKRDGSIMPRAEFDNTPEGHRNLCRWATKGGRRALACVEATGVYHLELALALNDHKKIDVMVVNPLAMRRYAQAMMKRAKTDRVDTSVILDYLDRMPFRAWEPPCSELFALRAITRRIFQLNRDIDREKNRHHATGRIRSQQAAVGNDIEVNLRHLKRRIAGLQAKAEAIIRSDQEMNEKFERLISVKGIAEVSAARILAELMFLPEDMKANQWVAYAGLDPVPDESGKKSKDKPKDRHISKKGNRYLRAALYMPALVAIKYSPNVKAFYQQLVARGKEKLQGIVAVMRKLLVAIWGMFKNRENFMQEKFYKIAA